MMNTAEEMPAKLPRMRNQKKMLRMVWSE